MDYFILSASEDGDVFFSKHTKEEVEKRLSEGYYGSDILTEIPKNFDLERWHGTLIIKGSLVAPKPIKIIEGYTID